MRNPTILCVDDERNVLLTLRTQLSRHFPAYAIEIAESAAEALALVDELLAEGRVVPLVIADQIMPGMKGDEFLIELHTRYPEILKVMLTGQASAENVGNVVNRGNLYRFIAKPWNEGDLVLTVTEAMRRYEQDQKLLQQEAELRQTNQELLLLNEQLEQQVSDRTQQLQEALDFNQQVIATAQEGIIVWDRDLCCRMWNPFMEELSGLPAAAVLGQYCLDVFPMLQAGSLLDCLQRALMGETITTPEGLFNVPETGRTGWSVECFTPLRDAQGTITGVLGTVHNITARKQAELEHQQLFKLLMDMKFALDQAAIVMTTDAQGRITDVNDRFCEISQYSRAELIGQTHQLVNSGYHPPDFFQTLWQTITSGQVWKGEIKNRAKDGSEYWMDTVIVPFLDDRGVPFQYMTIRFDTTERKQAETALRQSEASLADAQRIAQLGNWEFDLTTQQVSWSEELFHLYGRDASQWSPTYAKFQQQVPPEEWGQFEQIIQQAITQKLPYAIEHRVIRPNGEIRYALSKGEVAVDAQGQVYKLFGTSQDITEAKQAEAALRASEAQNRAILSALPDIMTVIDAEGTYLNCAYNQFSGELLTLEADQLIGLRVPDLLPQPYAGQLLDCIQQVLATGETQHYEQQIQFGDRTQYEEVRVVAYQADKVLCLVRNISDRKQAELELQKSQQLIQQIADSSPNVIYIYDLIQQRNIYVNREVYTFLGFTHEEVMTRIDQSLGSLMHPDDLPRAMQHFAQLGALPDGAIAEFEYRMRHKNGEWRWFSSRDTVFKRDAAGTVTQVLGNAQDITGRKQAEAALKDSERFLSMALAGAKAGVWEWDMLSDRTYWSDENFRLMGHEPGSIETTYAAWLDSVHPADRERANAYVAQVVAENSSLNLEYRVLLPDGSVRWLNDIGQIMLDDQGQALRMTGIQVDITDRKQAELELQEREHQLQAIASSIPGYLFRCIFHPDGSSTIPYITIGAEQIYGLPLSAITVDRSLAMTHPDDRLVVETVIASATQTLTPANFEFRLINGQGQLKWVNIIAEVHRTETGDTIFDGLGLDISDRKQLEIARQQLEAELREREAFLNGIYNGVEMAISVIDVEPDGTFRFVDFNPACTKLTGIEMTQLRGKTLDDLAAYMAADELEATRQQYRQCVDTGEVIQFEVNATAPNQQLWWLSCHAPLKDDTGRVYRLVGTSIPITDRKRAEARLAAQNVLLSRIAQGEPLPAILNTLIHQVEQHLSGALCSVLLLDSNSRLKHGAAPSLPPAYVAAVDGVQIGEGVGSCGTAAYRNETIIATDVATDPLWQDFKAIVLEHGLQACWSMPIATADGQVLGTFGVYYREPKSPQPCELEIIAQAANIAGIAIERDLTEAKIRQSQDQLRLTLEFTGIGAWNWHPITGAYEWNGKMEDLLQLPPGLENLYQTWCDRIHPDDLVRVDASIQQALTTRTPFTEEYRYRLQDGRYVWRWSKGQGVYAETGEVERILGVVQDITDRKQAELALQSAEERYSMATRAARVGVWEWNLKTNEIYLDPNIKALLGYTDAEISNDIAAWVNYVHPSDRAAVMAAAQEYLDGKTPEYVFEHRMLHKDGSIVWILVRGELLRDAQGNPERLIGTDTDISDRKAAEVILQESEARFRGFFNSTFQFMGLFTVDGRFIEVNETTLGFTGSTPDAIVNQYLWTVDWFKEMPAAHQVLQQNIAIAATGKLAVFEVQLRGKDGITLDLDASFKPMLDASGQVYQIVGEGRDITDRKQSEISLQRTNQLLSAISAAQTQFITDANPGILFDNLLETLLDLTQSEYGFIGEILYDPKGQAYVDEPYMKMRGKPYLKTKAITDIAWNEETRHVYDTTVAHGMEFHNLKTLFGQVMVTGEAVISNHPSTDPRRGGLPDGHPPLNAFLGVPFYRGEQLVGMVGIANRPDGYTEAVIAELEPFLTTCASTIEAYRNEARRKQAERDLQQLNAELEQRVLQRTEELARSERDLRTIFNNVYDAIFIHAQDGSVLDCNDRALALHGATREQLLAASIADLSASDSPMDVVPEHIMRLQACEVLQFEWKGRRFDNDAAFDVEVSLRSASLGNRPVIIACVRDISDRKRAELELQQLAAVVEASGDLIGIATMQGESLYLNAAGCSLIGVDPADLVGMPVGHFLPPDEVTRFEQEVLPMLLEQGHWQGETVFRHLQTQARIQVEQTLFLIHDPKTGAPLRMATVSRDISDRKQAEQALRDSEARFQAFMNNSPAASWITDQNGIMVYLSQTYYQTFQFPLTAAIGRSIFECYPPAIAQQFLNNIQTVVSSNQALETIEVAPRLDGTLGDFLVYKFPITESSGQRLVGGVAIDITDRKRAEAQLQEQEQFLRSIFEGSENPIFVIDVLPQGEFRYAGWNLACEKISGLRAADVIGKTPIEAMGVDQGTFFSRNYARCLQENSVIQYEEEFSLSPGTFWTLTTLNPLKNAAGEIFRIVGNALDITDRKQAELALKESEERFRQLAETVDAVFWLTDLQPQILYVSPAFERVWGRAAADVFSSRESFIQAIHPDDVEPATQRMARRFTEEVDAEYRILRPDGEIRWIRDRAFPIYTEAGEVFRVAGVAEDITDRKVAEAAAKQSGQDLRTIFNNVYDAIFIHDLDGVILDVNDRALELNRATRDQLLATSIAELSPPDAPLEQLPALFERAQTGETVHMEWICRRLGDRSTFIGEIALRLVSLSNRAVYIATVRDITDRKRSEAALRESEERFRTLFEATPNPIQGYDQNRRVIFWNRASEALYGYTRAEAIGRRVEELIIPEPAHAAVLPIVDAWIAGLGAPLPNGELQLKSKTGELIDVYSSHIMLTSINGDREMYCIDVDLRDRKKAEIALQEAKQFAQSIADKTPAALYIYDLVNQQNLYSNRSITEMLGYTQAEILHMGANLMPTLLHPDDAAKVSAHHQAIASATDGQDLELEYRMQHVEGDWRWFYSRDSVFKRDEKGNVLAYIGAAQDITDRKKLEHELRQINADLERRVEERTLDLQQAMEVAEAANRAKSTFLANMSHELRTPLNAILGFTQLMSRDLTLDPEKRNQLNIINRSGNHLLNLINDILEMSKIEAGRTVLLPNSFDLSVMIDMLAELFHLRAVEKGVQFIVDRDPELPHSIQTDENKLRQVLINLIGNAIKFTAAGFVKLRVRMQATAEYAQVAGSLPTLPFPTASDCVCLYFEVEDTGTGIDAAELDSLFEPFIQSSSRSAAQEGTGLGLPISRQFVQLLGGELTVWSVLGTGSRFAFTIPVALAHNFEVPVVLPQRHVIGIAPHQPPYRILVVEDNATNQQLLVQLLQSVGFEVQAANDGRQAIALWETWQPQLIWMDMRMPVMNGYDATRQIREKEALLRSPDRLNCLEATAAIASPTVIIALTASAFEEDRARVLNVGCNDFVRKPFQENELLEKMSEYLGIEYLYAEGSETAAPAAVLDTAVAIAALQTLPPEVIHQLHQATRQLDSAQLIQLCDQITPTQPQLAALFREKLEDFEFEQILRLLEEILR